MTDDTDDEDFDGHTHYFYDSDGHMYVDMTAVRERGRLEIVPLGGGEIVLGISELRVDKTQPVLNVAITADADDALREWYSPDPDPGNILDDTDRLYGHIEGLLNAGGITEEEAGRLRDRVNALEGDLEEMYERARDDGGM